MRNSVTQLRIGLLSCSLFFGCLPAFGQEPNDGPGGGNRPAPPAQQAFNKLKQRLEALRQGRAMPAEEGAEDEVSLVGAYICEGTDAEGNEYQGITEISLKGELYRVKWTLDVKGKVKEYSGIGLRKGDVLSVTWKVKESLALMVYELEQNDEGMQLVGSWIVSGENTVHEEVLTKVEDGEMEN